MSIKTSSQDVSRIDTVIYSSDATRRGNVTNLILTNTANPIIGNVIITDSSYSNTPYRTFDANNYYIKILGNNFLVSSEVYLNGSKITAANVTFVNSSEIRARLPLVTTGSYNLIVFNSNAAGAIYSSSLVSNPYPTWISSGSITNFSPNLNIFLVGSGSTSVNYSLAANSTLPGTLTLSSNGLISGTANAGTYTFTANLADTFNSTTQQFFTLRIVSQEELYYSNNSVLIRTDKSANGVNNIVILDHSPLYKSNIQGIFSISNRQTNGNLSQGSMNPFGLDGYWSGYYNGSTSYLIVNPTVPFQTANSSVQWTFDCWVYPISTNFSSIASNIFTSGNIPFVIGGTNSAAGTSPQAGGFVTMASFNGSTWTMTNANTALSLNTWTHLAISYDASRVRIYYNGKIVANSVRSWTTTTSSTNGFYVGRRWDASAPVFFPGYISNFRYVANTALYTQPEFLPPISPIVTNSNSLPLANATFLTSASSRMDDLSNTKTLVTNFGVWPSRFSPYSNNVSYFVSPSNTITSASYVAGPATHTGSLYFNGSDTMNVSTRIMNTLGDFGIEAWVYWDGNAPTNGGHIFAQWADAGSTPERTRLIITPFGAAAFNIGNEFVLKTANGLITQNTWNHIAVCRQGSDANNIAIYLNGRKTDQSTYTGNFDDAPFVIGNNEKISFAGYTGQIYGLRYTEGSCPYGSNFLPNPIITQQPNTKLLVCESSQKANTDSSNNAYNVVISTGTGPIISKRLPNYITYSAFFNGSSVSNTNITPISTNNFSIEFWMYSTGSSSSVPVSNYITSGGGDNGFYIMHNANNAISVLAKNEANAAHGIISSQFFDRSVWHHVAFAKKGTRISLFVNGSRVATKITGSEEINLPQTNLMFGYINSINETYFNGYLSNLRLIVNGDQYDADQSSITIPLVPLGPSGTGTKLVTFQDSSFIDNSNTNSTITSVTGVQSISNTIAPTVTFTSKDTSNVGLYYSGSYWFNGVSDYIQLPNNSDLTLTGDFTIEFFTLAYVNQRAIIECRSGASAVPWYIIVNSSGQLIFYAVSQTLTSARALPLATTSIGSQNSNCWAHVALVRQSGVIRFYINGVADTASITLPDVITPSAITPWIGRLHDAGYYYHGYLSNFRIIIGTAIYSGNTFSVPTTPLNPTEYENTKLCLLGTNASIYDNMMKSTIITYGNTAVLTGNTRARTSNNGILYFNTVGDFASITENATRDYLSYHLQSGDFTIELWANIFTLNTNPQIILSQWLESAGNGNYSLRVNANGTISFWFGPANEAAALLTSSTSITTNTWTHLAVVRSANTFTIYQNGSNTGGIVSTASRTSTSGIQLTLGGQYSSGATLYTPSGISVLRGAIDDIRINKSARYTTNFTPETNYYIV